MSQTALVVGMCTLIIAGVLFAGCDRNPFRARSHVNRGSCLQAVGAGICAVRNYAEKYGHFPAAGSNLSDLGEFSLPSEIAAMLRYGGSESLTLKSQQQTIVVECIFRTASARGSPQHYCALLSGAVVLVPERDAVPGQLAPIGTPLVAAPISGQ